MAQTFNSDGVPNSSVATTQTLEARSRTGSAYFGNSTLQTLAAAGNFRLTISNPSASGKTLYIYRLTGLTTATGFAHLYINPTAGLPATSRTVNNMLIGGAAGVGTVASDTSAVTALSGGTDAGVDFGLPANARFSLDLAPLVVGAGVTLGINVPFTGAAQASVTAYWWQE